ncbi:LYRM7-like protein [Mya arenaria]|uniref:Complex III assembly factor LYRM7 n=1 Tax=Mya arenaria TaxID=6604 RepID=A0ABY7DMT2_MYAAR|nr:complex III assembly factor LYRM7-like [Mya arenaria]WAQ97995.1 LYRM7-like protein [Mya arenaria]
MSSARSRVLSVFKQLHRTRKIVFEDDHRALAVIREKINEEFKKRKDIDNEQEVTQLITSAHDIEKELRTRLMQAQLDPQTGNFRLNITKDTEMKDRPEPGTPVAPRTRRNRKCEDESNPT